MKVFRLCKPYLLSQKYRLAAYIFLTMTTAAIAILSPFIIGDFLDTLIAGASIEVILRFCIIFGGLSLLKILKGYVTTMLSVKMYTKMIYNLNRDAIGHVHGLSLSFINQKDGAYLNQRLSTDSSGLLNFCVTMMQSIISHVFSLVVPFVILLNMNWFIALLMLAFIAAYIVSYKFFKKPVYNASFAAKEAHSNFFAKLFEQFKFTRLIKLNSVQEEMGKRTDENFGTYLDATLKFRRVSYLHGGLDGIISTLATIALFVVGGIQILAGNFTIGMFTIFTSYFNMMLGSVRSIFAFSMMYQDVLVSHDRVKEIFDQKLEGNGDKIIDRIEKIELKDLGFSYTAAGVSVRRVVDKFNAVFASGKIYAVSGANGTGKSTLVSLILGMYVDEYEGKISFNGADTREIDMVKTRKQLFGFAEQEPQLINESIKFNLSFGGEIDESKLEKYINLLNMQEFIGKNGLDFDINEKNTNTSGGEKQKISILKVLYKNPAVMIFDEPTSALDAGTTEKFMEYLKEIKRDKIVIIITHDDGIKENCDEVVSLSI